MTPCLLRGTEEVIGPLGGPRMRGCDLAGDLLCGPGLGDHPHRGLCVLTQPFAGAARDDD